MEGRGAKQEEESVGGSSSPAEKRQKESDDGGTPENKNSDAASSGEAKDDISKPASDGDDKEHPPQDRPNGDEYLARVAALDQSPLSDQKLDEIIPPGYEIVKPPAPGRAGEKIDDETDGELCQVRENGMEVRMR